MPKRLRTILLFLLLGAIANVIVSFGAALLLEPVFASDITPTEIRGLMARQSLIDWYRHNHIVAVEERSFAIRHIELADRYATFSAPGPSTSNVAKATTSAQPFPSFLTRVQSGWPLICFRGWYSLQGSIASSDRAIVMGERVLPYDPDAKALVINSLVYAGLLFVAIAGTSRARRLLRHHRGLCMNCAYDLRGAEHQRCPECGAVIRLVQPT